MKTLHFSITIHAPAAKVWDILWRDATYRQWTSAFAEGSHAVSDWEEGSKVLFLGPSGEGMFSMIDKKVPNVYMSFKHLGMVKDGKEQPEDEQSKAWSGAKETYTLSQAGDTTQLSVSVDIVESNEPYFSEAFPKALDHVKTLAEG